MGLRRHAKAPSAGSTSGTGNSRVRFGRAFATRGVSGDVDGSGARSRPRGLFAYGLFVCLLLTALIAPVAQAGKVPGFGVLGTGTLGGANGQLFNASGLNGANSPAVNRTGAGGVTAGDVYVADTRNHRIQQFTGAGAFVRAWGFDVVASGQHNTGTNEQQRVTVNATGGVFSLTLTTAVGSGRITTGSNTVTGVTTSIGAFKVGDVVASTGLGVPGNTTITAVGAGTLTLSANATQTSATTTILTATENTGATGGANLTAGSTSVTSVVTRSGEFAVGKTITGTGIPVGTTIAAVGPGTLTLSNPVEAGKSGTNVTITATNIPYNASAAQLQAALEALPGVGAGVLAVSGGPGGAGGGTPYVVTFTGGSLGGNDVVQMTGSNAGLIGTKTVTIATTIAGGGLEVCQAGSIPADTCKAGVAGATAGSLSEPQGLAIDQASGNIFVTSGNNRRVDVFSATGKFEGAFGWKVNVATPEEKLQLCTTVSGCQAGSSGAGAGQFSSLTNSIPAVSPADGNLYVPNPGGQRMDVFSPALNGSKELTGVSFVRGFGFDVTPTVVERQTVTLSGTTGGSFSLTFDSKATGGTGTGELEAGSNEITNLAVTGGRFVAGEAIAAPGVPAGTKITAVTFDSLTLSAPASATAAGIFSSSLPFDTSAAVLQAALRGLPNVGPKGAAVTGAAGGPWTIEFTGPIAGLDVPQIVGDGAALTGPGPSLAVATTQTGANGGSTEYERCTVVTGCKVGVTPGSEVDPGSFFSSTPTTVAVDSSGTAYVGVAGCSTTNAGTCRVYKVSQDASTIEDFAPSLLVGLLASDPNTIAVTDLAVDPANDHLLIVKKTGETSSKIYEFTKDGGVLEISPPGEAGLVMPTGVSPRGFAIGTSGRQYLGVLAGRVAILGSPPAPSVTVDPPSAVGASSATFSGTVTPAAPGIEGGFATVYHFEYSTDGVKWESTATKEAGTGSGSGNPNNCPVENPSSCVVSEPVTGLEAGANYLVRLVASNGTEGVSSVRSFSTGGDKPTVSAIPAQQIESTFAIAQGLVNPNNRSTSYHFEWGTSTSYGTSIPADLDAIAGSGGKPVTVNAKLSGLQPGTVYHFRIVATNVFGTTNGPDQQFITLNASGLPNNRVPEMVSPASKQPQGFVGSFDFGAGRLYAQAAEEGSSFAYPILNGLEDSTSGGNTGYRATRTDSGWQSQQVSAPALIPSAEGTGFMRAYSSDLGCAVVETDNPLTEDTPETGVLLGVSNIYLWSSGAGYELISRPIPSNPAAIGIFGGGHKEWPRYQIAGISPDCSRVYFRTAYVLFDGASGLYEWHDGTLRDAGRLPNGAVPVGPAGVGGSFDDYTQANPVNALSRNGSHFFFTAVSNEGGSNGKRAVFASVDHGAKVVDASKPTTAVPSQGARYEMASKDGSRVFFLANYGIAATTSPGATTDNCTAVAQDPGTLRRCDLYMYDVEAEQLTDISADTNPANPRGAVVEGVLDVSEDGSHVYFAAIGQLVPGEGKTYAQNLQGEKYANVYHWHNGALTFVANLTLGDLGSSRQFLDTRTGALAHFTPLWVSRATPDGQFLVFLSEGNVTGYESGRVPQVYRYSAEDDAVVCISCRPDGLPSVGHNNTTPLAGTYLMPGQFYFPRSMSDDGNRIFFNSEDVLKPGAVPGNYNVYMWENGQVYFLTTATNPYYGLSDEISGAAGGLLDSSTSGDDVFIATSQKLDPNRDVDYLPDVYDMRVDGGFPFTPVTPCDPAADQCQGPPSSPPAAPSTGTGTVTGPGNPPVTKPKPKKHKKKHHKKKKKKQQKKSNRNARAANNNAGGAK